MAGGVLLTGDWRELAQAFRRAASIDWRAVHVELGEQLVANVSQRFDRQRDPRGRRWAPSRRAAEKGSKTVRGKRGGSRTAAGGRTLVKSGRLKRSVKYRAAYGYLDLGTNLVYGRIHNQGGEIKPKKAKYLRFKVGKNWVAAKKVKIPQRQYLGLSGKDERDVQAIVGRRIRRALAAA